jgi:hypothetical protein
MYMQIPGIAAINTVSTREADAGPMKRETNQLMARYGSQRNPVLVPKSELKFNTLNPEVSNLNGLSKGLVSPKKTYP